MGVTPAPLFSIVIPTWNRAALLQRCLESIVAQDFTDYEVVVVDDGSTDDTAQVLARFAPRVRAMRQPGKGPSDARNHGVSAAAGRFVVFVDSDDVLMPWALRAYEGLIVSGNPAMLLAAFRSFVDESELADFEHPHEPPSVLRFATYLDAAAEGHLSGTHRLVIERNVYVGAKGLSTDLRVCEDQDFGLRINQTGPCHVIVSPPTVGYRAHSGNISKDVADFGRGIGRIIRAEQHGIYPGGPARAALRRSVITRTARSASIGCVRQGWYRQGLGLYFETLAWNVRQRRLRYVLGFPLQVLASLASRRFGPRTS